MNNKGLKDKTFKCIYCDKYIPFKGYNRSYKYCDNKCQGLHIKEQAKQNNLALFNEGKLKSRRRIFEFLVDRDGNKCSVCGITQWQDKPIRFWVDHIDGNSSNNMPNNFRLICLNCDSQSSTFMSKNIGNGRTIKNIEGFKTRKTLTP